jgi:hypothetical protein
MGGICTEPRFLDMRNEHDPAPFILGERVPSNHWIGGWVDRSAGPDDLEKKRQFFILQGLELVYLELPVSRQSLYCATQLSHIPVPLNETHIPRCH